LGAIYTTNEKSVVIFRAAIDYLTCPPLLSWVGSAHDTIPYPEIEDIATPGD
jgi:hypothetical protein